MNQGYNVLFSAISFTELDTLTWRYQVFLFATAIKLLYDEFLISNMVLYCPLCSQFLLKSVANVEKCLRSERKKITFVEYNRKETIQFFTFFQFLNKNKNKNKNKKRRRRRRRSTTTKTDNRSQWSTFIL